MPCDLNRSPMSAPLAPTRSLYRANTSPIVLAARKARDLVGPPSRRRGAYGIRILQCTATQLTSNIGGFLRQGTFRNAAIRSFAPDSPMSICGTLPYPHDATAFFSGCNLAIYLPPDLQTGVRPMEKLLLALLLATLLPVLALRTRGPVLMTTICGSWLGCGLVLLAATRL